MIEFISPRLMDQAPGTETWALCSQKGKPVWKCFRGQRFSVELMICDGKLEEVCAEAQALRESCSRKPNTKDFHICWEPRQLLEQYEHVVLRRDDGTVRFALVWVVTNGNRVLGEFYREDRPEEEPIVSFRQAIHEWVEEALKEKTA